jgi:hypothetical protein
LNRELFDREGPAGPGLSFKESAMGLEKSPNRVPTAGLGPQAGESNGDYRERLARVHAEALERRQQELHEQSAPHNDASARIRIWERLHQIDLPRNPAHRLIDIIAANTGLSASDVLAEQQIRANARAPKPADSI